MWIKATDRLPNKNGNYVLKNIQTNHYSRSWFSDSGKCILRRLPYLYVWLDENHDDYPISLYEKWNHEQQKYNLAKDSLHQQRITAYENEIIELKHAKDYFEEALQAERECSSHYRDRLQDYFDDRHHHMRNSFLLGILAGIILTCIVISFL